MTLHDEPSGQAVCTVSQQSGNSATRLSALDSMSRQRILADDELTEYLISHTFHRLMTAANETDRRYWCDRLLWWIAQRWPTSNAQGVDTKKPQVLA